MPSYPEGEGILEQEPKCHFLQGDTRDVEKKWQIPWIGEVDFMLHDTSHRYEETKAELEIYPKLIRKRGIYTMHDTGHEAGDGMGCRQALNEWYEKNKEEWTIVHLLDTKIIGMSVLCKI